MRRWAAASPFILAFRISRPGFKIVPASEKNNVKTLHKYLTGQVLASLVLTVAVFTFVLLLGDFIKNILSLLINGQARPGIIFEAVGMVVEG